MQAVVQEVDDDGSGEIEFDEFVKIMEGDKKQLTEDELKSEFMNMTTMTLPDEGSGKPEVITIMNMRAIADLLGEEKTDEELQVRIAGTALPLHAVVALWSRHQRVVLVRAGHRPCLLRRARNSRNHRLTLVRTRNRLLVQEMLDELDVDKEGCVGWREFKTMVRKAREWGIED